MKTEAIGGIRQRAVDEERLYKCKHGAKERWYVQLPNSLGTMLNARWVIEKVRRRILPQKAIVHHIDGNTLNDDLSNLVVCEDAIYHKLLHVRAEALKATGNPHSRKCHFCQRWGVPGEGDMVTQTRKRCPNGTGNTMHKSCAAEHMRDWRRKKEEKGG